MQRDDRMERLEAEIADRAYHDETLEKISRDLSVPKAYVAAVVLLTLPVEG